MQLEPARTQTIIMNRSLWGHQLRLQVTRTKEDGTVQLGHLMHATRLLENYFYVFQRAGELPRFTEEYRSLNDLIAAGWRAS
jgi:hypothetical protein